MLDGPAGYRLLHASALLLDLALQLGALQGVGALLGGDALLLGPLLSLLGSEALLFCPLLPLLGGEAILLGLLPSGPDLLQLRPQPSQLCTFLVEGCGAPLGLSPGLFGALHGDPTLLGPTFDLLAAHLGQLLGGPALPLGALTRLPALTGNTLGFLAAGFGPLLRSPPLDLGLAEGGLVFLFGALAGSTLLGELHIQLV